MLRSWIGSLSLCLWFSVGVAAMDVLVVHDAGYEEPYYTPGDVEAALEFLKDSGYVPVLINDDHGAYACVLRISTYGDCSTEVRASVTMVRPYQKWLASGTSVYAGFSSDQCHDMGKWSALRDALFPPEARMNIIWTLRQECGDPRDR